MPLWLQITLLSIAYAFFGNFLFGLVNVFVLDECYDPEDTDKWFVPIIVGVLWAPVAVLIIFGYLPMLLGSMLGTDGAKNLKKKLKEHKDRREARVLQNSNDNVMTQIEPENDDGYRRMVP